MQTRLSTKSIQGIIFAILLLAGMIGCDLTGAVSTPDPAAPIETATVMTVAPTPTEPVTTTVNGPEGMVLTLEGEALTADAEVTLEVMGETDLSTQGTPFEAVGPEYRVGFGEGDQIGGITLTVPLSQTAKLAAPAGAYVYAAWARPEDGLPSMVGVIANEGLASMPVVGAGTYQVLQILHPDAATAAPLAWKPLAVPSYWQQSCGWCSTTALTDVAAYHEGAWPSGGYGGAWGESSNWYLGGLAGQSCPKGFFFHWLLNAGGYSTPSDVKQSFVNGNAEVIIWNWKSAKMDEWDLELLPMMNLPWSTITTEEYISSRLEFTISLFEFFHAYVETNVWGQNGARRPVAWGSALAGHSRVITGSDGQNFFFNNPSSGSLNDSKPWEAYLQEVIASILPDSDGTEIIDTAVFYADPRPSSERRGALWLTQWSSNREGSLVLRRGEAGTPAAYWHWDGAEAHDYGYYFEDLIGDLPADPTFDVQFKAFSADDAVEYGFAVRSISDASYDFVVKTELFSETGEVQTINFADRDATVNAGGRADIYPAGSVPIGGLPPGLYRLKFTLSQAGVVQDVKYVFFRLAPRGYILQLPIGVLQQSALCRKGPGTAYAVVTGFEALQQLALVGVNLERTWGKFEAESGGSKFQCWISLNLMELRGDADVPVLAPPPLPIAPTLPACAQYTTPQTCGVHAECTWNRLVTPALCQPK